MREVLQNRTFVIAGAALIAVIAIVAIIFIMRGRKPAQTSDAAGGFGDTAAAPAAGAGQQLAAAPGEESPAAPGGAAPAAAEGGAAPAAAEGDAAPQAEPEVRVGVIKMGRGVDEPSRPDAFLTFEPKIPPPPPEVTTPLPATVLGPLRPAQPAGAAVLGQRRVAGVVFNDRPWAILEESGKTFIVKPGDIVDGIRVTAIARNAIYIQDPEGRRWEVPLRGTGPAAVETRGTESGYLTGMPELPSVSP